MKKLLAMVSLIAMSGCFQVYDDDVDLRTVPITNNPTIVPNHGSMIPGMGGAQSPH